MQVLYYEWKSLLGLCNDSPPPRLPGFRNKVSNKDMQSFHNLNETSLSSASKDNILKADDFIKGKSTYNWNKCATDCYINGK